MNTHGKKYYWFFVYIENWNYTLLIDMFETKNLAIFEGKKSSNDITNNDTISDDDVVAFYVPPRFLL